ncbi:hypothetical protein E1B28_008129 [Marasmius oreades]|uniref:Uncharacterized protein n=1 Tax=Marasmius oreades TaxID=181124 RepID=A0A9P7URT3_9AGAR|nr:uncharacterized protein E1B28_008129 [Marasmius oreades]KAG7091728.1 hypothetical protein E1B28_008129 [Marasmius oreades]
MRPAPRRATTDWWDILYPDTASFCTSLLSSITLISITPSDTPKFNPDFHALQPQSYEYTIALKDYRTVDSLQRLFLLYLSCRVIASLYLYTYPNHQTFDSSDTRNKRGIV